MPDDEPGFNARSLDPRQADVHDLRNMLARIVMLAEGLQQGSYPAEARRLATDIIAMAVAAAALVSGPAERAPH